MAPRPSTSLPKRTTLTYKQRLEVCEHKRAYPRMNHMELADWVTWHFQLPKAPSESSIRKILMNEAQWKHELERAVDATAASNMRKKGSVQAPEVEAALIQWIADQPRDVKVKGREIQAKAEELATTLGVPDNKRPKFSKGWLCSFQERYNLKAASASRKRPSLSAPIPARIVLTYKQRAELCDHADANPTLNNTQLAEWATTKFNLRKYISIHAVGRIIKRADEWRRVSMKDAKTMRHWREPIAPELDTRLANWVHKQRERGVKVTGKLIIEQGRAIARQLRLAENEQPKFSKGWLSSFMTRHKLAKHRLPKKFRDAVDRQKKGEEQQAQAAVQRDEEYGDDIDLDAAVEPRGEHEEDDDDEGLDDDEYPDDEEDDFEDEEEDDEDVRRPPRKQSRVDHLLN